MKRVYYGWIDKEYANIPFKFDEDGELVPGCNIGIYKYRCPERDHPEIKIKITVEVVK